MDPFCRRRRSLAPFLAASTSLGALFVIGCASPTPPRAPSLNLPQLVTDLSASRIGNTVELRYTLPHLSTDRLPLFDPKHHRTTIHGTFCREIDHQDCASIKSFQQTLTGTPRISIIWQDELPQRLTVGAPHLLGYRVEFFNADGRSAGKSQPAFTVSGEAPGPVSSLHSEGTRRGILVEWSPTPKANGEIILNRIDLRSKPVIQTKAFTPKPSRNARITDSAMKHDIRDDETWLSTNSATGRTLDTNVVTGEPYRYTAIRRIMVPLGNRTFEIRSAPSAPTDITLAETFPPDAPTALTVAGFQPPAAAGEIAHFAADLIWQPVDNSVAKQIASPIVGYNIYRESLDAQGHITASRTRLNAAPVAIPGYHDTTAEATIRYRYSVTAVDGKSKESASAYVTLDPAQQ
jgi:hypothetical protein